MTYDNSRPLMSFNCGQAALGPPLSAEEIAQRLFDLLDDIDTYDDMAKDNEALYRNLVRKAHVKRFQFATTDGYSMLLNTPENAEKIKQMHDKPKDMETTPETFGGLDNDK